MFMPFKTINDDVLSVIINNGKNHNKGSICKKLLDKDSIEWVYENSAEVRSVKLTSNLDENIMRGSELTFSGDYGHGTNPENETVGVLVNGGTGPDVRFQRLRLGSKIEDITFFGRVHVLTKDLTLKGHLFHARKSLFFPRLRSDRKSVALHCTRGGSAGVGH
eukprot:797796_1